MRVVAGHLRGRPLATPQHEGVRPTSDRVREALFNILTHGVPNFEIVGAKVLDLFAGTGALGIEALSRGAGFCLFVEDNADARALIRRNIEAFGLSGVTKLYRRDATDLGPAGNRDTFSLVFADPPYGRGLGEKALAAAAAGGWLAPASAEFSLPSGFEPIDERRWGSTQVVIARYSPSPK